MVREGRKRPITERRERCSRPDGALGAVDSPVESTRMLKQGAEGSRRDGSARD